MSLVHIKKQAKRLHKVLPEMLAKNKEINLSFSQELVAQQYGYPSFHAAQVADGKQNEEGARRAGHPASQGVFPLPLSVDRAGANHQIFRSLGRAPQKVLSGFPMISSRDRSEYTGGIGFFDMAAARSFDVYLVWTGKSQGRDEYSLALRSCQPEDTTLFEIGAFFNNDCFREYFLSRLMAELEASNLSQAHQVVSLCCFAPVTYAETTSSLHIFPVSAIADFEASVHVYGELADNPWMSSATDDMIGTIESETALTMASQILLIYLHWVLERKLSKGKGKDPLLEKPGYDPILDWNRFERLMLTLDFAAEAIREQATFGVGLTIPDPQKSPICRIVDSYTDLYPRLKTLLPTATPWRTKLTGENFKAFSSVRHLSGIKSILKRSNTLPLDFGVSPKVLCFSPRFSLVSGLFQQFIRNSISSERTVIHLSRGAESSFPDDIAKAVTLIDLKLLEQSPQEVGERLKGIFLSHLNRADLSFVIEDCDELAKHPAFGSIFNHICDMGNPCLLLAEQCNRSSQERLLSVIDGRQDATIFVSDEIQRSASWFNQSLPKGVGLKPQHFEGAYCDKDAIVFRSRSVNAGTVTKGDWFGVQL